MVITKKRAILEEIKYVFGDLCYAAHCISLLLLYFMSL